ncbi:MAG: Imm50 family immunity protein [Archangium sp.]|nr:Imm50 family immunity protein [Archangium sp.]
MDWIDSVGSAEFLRKLFPKAPSLHRVRILEVDLHQDGPRVLVRLDLNEFPEQAPDKWVQSNANKVQVRLMGVGVQDLEVRGWSANNIADIEILASGPDGVRFIATGAGFQLKGVFEHLAVDSVSAYTDPAA